MDIDLLKSTPADDQIEMMLMMHMHQDKSPADHVINSGGPHSDSSPMMSFSGNPGHHSSSAPTTAMPQLYDSTQNPFVIPNSFGNGNGKQTSMAAMREMIFRIAAMQPIYIDPESVKPPKRRNVRISKDPQSVAARHRRERISERIRILQRLVPGGTKMDTASMLDEAIHYVKFLKTQVQSLEHAAVNNHRPVGLTVGGSSRSGYFPVTDGRGNNDYYCYYSHGGHTATAPAAQRVQQFSDG